MHNSNSFSKEQTKIYKILKWLYDTDEKIKNEKNDNWYNIYPLEIARNVSYLVGFKPELAIGSLVFRDEVIIKQMENFKPLIPYLEGRDTVIKLDAAYGINDSTFTIHGIKDYNSDLLTKTIMHYIIKSID